MSERKARARRKATQRSRENNRWRRKDAGVEVTDRQRELWAELHAATVQREQLLKSADESFRKALKEIEAARKDTVAAAWAGYDKARAKIVEKMAEEEQAAA